MEYSRETKKNVEDSATLQQREYKDIGHCLDNTCTENQHKKIIKKYLVHFRLFLFIVRSSTYTNLRQLVSDDHDVNVLTHHMVTEKMIRRVIIPRLTNNKNSVKYGSKRKKPTELFQFLEIEDSKDLSNLLAMQLFGYIIKKKFDETWKSKGENVPNWNQILSTWKEDQYATEEDQNLMKKIIKYWAEYYKTSLNWNMKEWHEEQHLYKRALGLS